MAQEIRRRTGTQDGEGTRQQPAGAGSPKISSSKSSFTQRFLMLSVVCLLVNILHPMDPAVSIADPIVKKGPEPNQTPGPIGKVAEVVEEFFPCSGHKCHAWLVLPKKPLLSADSRHPPVVVMGHGLACMKDMGLYTYAVAFAEVGIASYLIDYRGFGLSDGEPRSLVDAAAHASDFVDAVHHIAADSRIDSARIALWGTSLSGGHVIQAAGILGEKVASISRSFCVIQGAENPDISTRSRL